MEERSEFVERLRRIAIFGGITLGVFSVFFSYDGLDQSITGGNPEYRGLAKVVGIALAAIITLLQFIFNTDYKNLNMTLKIVGALSYGYSIWTNYLGITHLFGFDPVISWSAAIFMDVTPESLIAWGMRDALRGDFLGNLGKLVWGERGPGGGGGRGGSHRHNGSGRRIELERQRDRGGFRSKPKQPAHGPLTNAELDEKIRNLGYRTHGKG